MIELSLNKIKKYYAANKILDDVTFEAKSQERIAIVGRNGTGKTSIFKIISGIEKYDGGIMAIRKGAKIGYLDQIPDYPKEYRVIDVLNKAFDSIFDIKSKMSKLEKEMGEQSKGNIEKIMKEYGKLQSQFEHKGGYDIEEKISKVCVGLKIDEDFKNRKFVNLSGGEKTTVILGKILLENPDILLLDEPSNHLDINSVEWLEEFLKEYKGTVLVISHDRYFLDKVANRVVEVEDKKTTTYEGNYSYYVKEKEKRLLEQYKHYQNQQKKLKSMEEAVKRFRDWGNRADNEDMFKKAKSMEKRMEKMDKIDKPILERKKIGLDFEVSGRSANDVVIVENITKSFGENMILKNLSLNIKYGEKLCLLGKNGTGKSTLIKILTGDYKQDSGKVKIGSNVKIGYLDQNIKFNNENLTILEEFRQQFIMPEGKARGILAKFLFYDTDVFKKVCNLSGGEKSRLKLCMLMHSNINFLLLDEPTNHLDVDSREMLEDTLQNFNGTILFVSHDRYFVNKISEKIVELENNRLTGYLGNYDYYKKKKEELMIGKTKRKEKDKKMKKKEKNIKRNQGLDDDAKIKQEIINVEKEIEIIEGEIATKDKEMENNSTDHEKLGEIYGEKEELENRLNDLLERWTELNMSIKE
ncbi:ribosomal protection-like ABC-F family protein [Dethiothermospora halolimnae]|uniref:ribosomal protection-like ABC-F family protein n=1 Tax=Dethiothermospora halolimnae TaxID=3114390 RepID=UPI003CCBB3DD